MPIAQMEAVSFFARFFRVKKITSQNNILDFVFGQFAALGFSGQLDQAPKKSKIYSK